MPINRSLARDFIAGIDPTGTETTRYGAKDISASDRERNIRRGVGTLGGVVGGGVVLPSVISGIIGAAKGAGGGAKGAARGFVKGLAGPISHTTSAIRLQRVLRGLESGKKMSRSEINAALSAAKNVLPSSAKPLLHAGKLVPSSAYSAIPKPVVRKAAKHIGSKVRVGLGGLGLSGLIGGGSAYLQYGKGGRMGEIMSPEQRRQI